MKADLLVLQVCDFLDDGDGFYRLHEPSRQLSRLPGVVVIDCHYYHRLLPGLMATADVLVLPFLHNWDLFSKIEARRAAGQVTVFEANDYFYDVQPWNPISSGWQDRAIQDEYRLYMGAADLVQTSTRALERRWQKWAKRVAVFENQLSHIPPLGPPPNRPLTIGWGGSPGHFADWYHAAPALEAWLNAHPTVRLAVMCNEFAKPFVSIPAERYQFTPFGSLPQYLQFLTILDIGLAPLLPSEYNRCRSDVKFLEYASHGVTGIYAALDPYLESVRHGETGLIYQNEREMVDSLDRLAGDADLRMRIRKQGYEYVTTQRRVEDHIGTRLETYRQLLGRPGAGQIIPDEVIAASQRDGSYLQLRPQEAEKALIGALQASNPRETLAQLRHLVDRYPGYLIAREQLGRVCNDLREHPAALSALEYVSRVDPNSAQVLCEMARARYMLNDNAGARRDLQAALKLNPQFYPGWLYFLRFLELTKATDGPEWLEKARSIFPRNFTVALAGARFETGLAGVAYLTEVIDQFANMLTVEERASAVAAFSQVIQAIAGPYLASPEAVQLLERSCTLFPKSSSLADMLARAFRLAGRHAESRAEFIRALELRRAAEAYRAEFPKEDGRIHYWQFAEAICRYTGEP
jgi:tetratricopeptide (TPR) repeat protein